MNEREFRELIEQPEGVALDFKQEPYKFDNDWKISNFLKDILAMANTPRDRSAFIILGIEAKVDGSKNLLGITDHIDDNELQIKLDNKHAKIQPRPTFSYHPFSFEGKIFGIIELPVRKDGPYFPTGDFGSLKARYLYIRKGSKNTDATVTEQSEVYKWFRQPADLDPKIDLAFLQTSTHADFDATVRKLLSKKDNVNLSFISDELSREICNSVKPEDTELSKNVIELLDKLTCLLVTTLRVREQDIFNVGLKGLVKAYSNFFEEHGYLPTRTENIATRKLLIEIAIRVVALGGYAVRIENWQAVHDLILQAHPQESHTRLKPKLWVRNAEILAAGDTRVVDPIYNFLFAKSSKIVEELECLRVDLPLANPNIKNSLLQFDCLTALVALVKGGTSWYPNFAVRPTTYTQPIVVKLLQNPAMRRILFDGTPSDADLAKYINQLTRIATEQSFTIWMGFDNPVIEEFLAHYLNDSF